MASLTPQEKKLDKLFSQWVRKSAIVQDEVFKCYTCGKPVYWKEGNASHYIPRTHKATRWDERNVKASCVHCNKWLEGNHDEFALHLVKDYGEGILEELNRLKWSAFKADPLWLEEKITHYQNELKNL